MLYVYINNGNPMIERQQPLYHFDCYVSVCFIETAASLRATRTARLPAGPRIKSGKNNLKKQKKHKKH